MWSESIVVWVVKCFFWLSPRMELKHWSLTSMEYLYVSWWDIIFISSGHGRINPSVCPWVKKKMLLSPYFFPALLLYAFYALKTDFRWQLRPPALANNTWPQVLSLKLNCGNLIQRIILYDFRPGWFGSALVYCLQQQVWFDTQKSDIVWVTSLSKLQQRRGFVTHPLSK